MDRWLVDKGYSEGKKTIDNIDIKYYYNIKKNSNPECPKILVASYQPNSEAQELTRVCLECIKKFTEEPYEVWVIDDYSPLKNIRWMTDLDQVNTVFVRTEPKEIGSYGLGIVLEIGTHLIDKKTEYIATFHSDTVVCKEGWLKFLISKLDERVRASGFRFTTERVPEGVLHVCGYLIDFQLYKKLNLSFMPKLPGYDTGDEIIHEFLKNGYKIYAIKNTFDNPELIEKLITPSDPIYNINSTRAFNDKNEIIYMHLGRGIRKTEGEYEDLKKTTSEEWLSYIRRYLLDEKVHIPEKSNVRISIFRKVAKKVKRFLKKLFNR